MDAADKFEPAEVFCLAELLSDELQARGWRTQDVALRMGGTAEHMANNLLALDLVMCVHDDKLLVGDKLFDGLAKAFDVDPQFFRNIDASWRKYPDRRRPFRPPDSIFGPISRRAFIRPVT